MKEKHYKNIMSKNNREWGRHLLFGLDEQFKHLFAYVVGYLSTYKFNVKKPSNLEELLEYKRRWLLGEDVRTEMSRELHKTSLRRAWPYREHDTMYVASSDGLKACDGVTSRYVVFFGRRNKAINVNMLFLKILKHLAKLYKEKGEKHTINLILKDPLYINIFIHMVDESYF